MTNLCEKADYKEAVTKKVKSIHCKYAKDDSSHELKLQGTELVFAVGPNVSNLTEKVQEYLEKNL